MKVKIIKVDTTYQDPDSLVELFDQYRMFYKQESDIASAKKFISDRINNNDSTIFVACDENTNNAIGFVQLYPSFTYEYRKKGVAKKLIDQAHMLWDC